MCKVDSQVNKDVESNLLKEVKLENTQFQVCHGPGKLTTFLYKKDTKV